jgi:hypothetical protein
MILSYPEAAKDKELLTQIQRNLHATMSILCNAPVEVAAIKEHIHELEEYIDDVEKQKPTGTKYALRHGAYAECRRRIICVTVLEWGIQVKLLSCAATVKVRLPSKNLPRAGICNKELKYYSPNRGTRWTVSTTFLWKWLVYMISPNNITVNFLMGKR